MTTTRLYRHANARICRDLSIAWGKENDTKREEAGGEDCEEESGEEACSKEGGKEARSKGKAEEEIDQTSLFVGAFRPHSEQCGSDERLPLVLSFG